MFCCGTIVLAIAIISFLNQSPLRFINVMVGIFSVLWLGSMLDLFLDLRTEKSNVAYQQMSPSVRQNPASWRPGLLYTGYKVRRYGGYSGGGYSGGK
ncbi:MAG: hypothetical protein VX278_02685 [Myxococcota bacterium]|nr:hypothetical protein [Myxococcota bacterium]